MKASPSHIEQGDTLLRGDSETPFRNNNALQVTPEELAGIRALIRELKPGLYIKCYGCEKLKYGMDEIHIESETGAIYCKGCWA